MGIIRNRSLISRAKHADNRVYVPADARDNQYVIVDIEVNEALIAKLSDQVLNPEPKELLTLCLNKMRRLVQQHDIQYAALVASKHFIRVRYGVDSEIITTPEQHLFYYNPQRSHGLIAVCPEQTQTIKSLRLVCFACGDEIRDNAAVFHRKVSRLCQQLKHDFTFIDTIKIQDHQHISFNMAKHTAHTQSKAHGFRELEKRYASSDVNFPTQANSKAFVIIKASLSHLLEDYALNSQRSALEMHNDVANLLMHLANLQGISNFAYVASKCYPVVKSNYDVGSSNNNAELVSLNFGKTAKEINVQIDDDIINGDAYFVFYMDKSLVVKSGYASYINKIIKLVDQLADKLTLSEGDRDMLLRFYQHLSYCA